MFGDVTPEKNKEPVTFSGKALTSQKENTTVQCEKSTWQKSYVNFLIIIVLIVKEGARKKKESDQPMRTTDIDPGMDAKNPTEPDVTSDLPF